MKQVITYILDRLKERSTWMGLISVITAMGVSVSPELSTALVSAGISIAGLIAMITKD